jgi:[ribosomal protein S5]-alanine N-acetyltransferase
MLQTARLQLIPCDIDLYKAIFEGNKTLSGMLGVNIPKKWTEFPEAIKHSYQVLKNDPSIEAWGMYLVISRADNLLIGICGFKGKPTPDGIVEIGYEIKPSHRQKGLASEAAQALVHYALDDEHITQVQAHTLPAESPSTHILEKIGFQYTDTVEDPTDGTIWKWVLMR